MIRDAPTIILHERKSDTPIPLSHPSPHTSTHMSNLKKETHMSTLSRHDRCMTEGKLPYIGSSSVFHPEKCCEGLVRQTRDGVKGCFPKEGEGACSQLEIPCESAVEGSRPCLTEGIFPPQSERDQHYYEGKIYDGNQCCVGLTKRTDDKERSGCFPIPPPWSFDCDDFIEYRNMGSNTPASNTYLETKRVAYKEGEDEKLLDLIHTCLKNNNQ